MARDGQSTALQATVIVLTLLTVGLGVTSWLGYSEAQKATARATSAEAAQKAAQDTARNKTYVAKALEHMVRGVPDRESVNGLKGLAAATDPDVINANTLLTDFDNRMKQFVDAAPEGGRDYSKVLDFTMRTINERNVTVADARTRDKENEGKLKSAEDREKGRADAAETRATKAEADQKAEYTKFEADRAKYKEDLKKVEADKVTAIQEREKEVKQLKEEVAGLRKLNTTLTSTNDALASRLKRLDEIEREGSPARYEVADGEITAVSQRTQLVWINLGSADGLRPQMTFSVFAHDENRNTIDRKKGSIEVVKILEPHLAECRIMQPNDPAEKSKLFTEPLLPGDKLFNPGWSPGQVLRFAIAGFIDIDGDGKSDREIIRSVIENSGSVIDAEVTDDGKLIGAPSVVTRYLIRGEDPRVKRVPGQSDENAKKTADAYSTLVKKCADEFNVEQIDASKFLAMMGWKVEQRTTMLGARRDASKFRVRKPGDAAAGAGAAASEKPAAKPAATEEPAADSEDPFDTK